MTTLLPRFNWMRRIEPRVDVTAKIAQRLYDEGKVTLVQKRLAPELYEYIAVRL